MTIGSIDSLNNQDLRNFVYGMSSGSVGLAEGTGAHTLQTKRAVSYRVGPQALYFAAQDNIAMTACTAQAGGTTCYYLVSLNSAGAAVITKGADDAASLPSCPEDAAVIGAIKVVTAGVTFTSGTKDLSAAGITATFADLNFYPADGSADLLTFS